MHDSDLISALSALCTSYERLVSSGLHYEQALTTSRSEQSHPKVEAMLKQYREVEQKHAGYSSLRDSDVLEPSYFWFAWHTDEPQAVPSRVAFIDFLAAQFPEGVKMVAPQEAAGRIIMP